MEPEMSTGVQNSSSTTASPLSDSSSAREVFVITFVSVTTVVFVTIMIVYYRRYHCLRLRCGRSRCTEEKFLAAEPHVDEKFLTAKYHDEDSILLGEHKTRSKEKLRGRRNEPTEGEPSTSVRALCREIEFTFIKETIQTETRLSSPPVSKEKQLNSEQKSSNNPEDGGGTVDRGTTGYQESHELCLPVDISETHQPKVNWNQVFNYLARNVIRPASYPQFFSELFRVENAWNIIEETNHTCPNITQRIVILFHRWKQTAGTINLEVSIQEAFRRLEWKADLDKFDQYMRNPPTLQEQKFQELPESTFGVSEINWDSFVTPNKNEQHSLFSDNRISQLERTLSQKVVRNGVITNTLLKQTVEPQSFDAENKHLQKRKRKQNFPECDKDQPHCRENKGRKLDFCEEIKDKKDNSRKPYVKSPSGKYMSEERIKVFLTRNSRKVHVITKTKNKSSPKYPQFRSKSKESTRTSRRNNGEFLSPEYEHGSSSEWNFCPSVSGLNTGNFSVRGNADGCEYISENEKSVIITLVEKLTDSKRELGSNEYQVFVKTILERFSKEYQPKPRILELTMDDLEQRMCGFFLPKGDNVVAFSDKEWELLQLYFKVRSNLSCSVKVNEVFVTYDGVPLKDV